MLELKTVIEAIDKIKATNIKIYDLRGVSPFADYSVVATVDVARQGNACVDYLDDFAKEGRVRIKNVEGQDSSWVLIDLYDIIVHLFTKEERANYDLDSLYMDIPQLNNL